MRNPEEKILTIENAVLWHKTLQQKNKKLVITNGCFDLMHRGHAQYLYLARMCGDALLVAINSDQSIRELKGDDRPLIAEKHRAYMLASLECVDAVVVFYEQRATKLFSALKPEIYVKGGDYCEDTLDREEYTILKKSVQNFSFIPFVDGFSTTSLIEKISKNG